MCVRGSPAASSRAPAPAFLSKSSLEMCGVLDLKGFGLQAIQGVLQVGGPTGSPEAQVLVCTPSSAGHLPGGCVGDGPRGGSGLIASCRAAAAEAGTARRWRPWGLRPRGQGAQRPGSCSPQSWSRRRARRRTGTGRMWLGGTGCRLGWPACTPGRVRTAMGRGRPGSPRWAGRWLEGRCSGGSACGAKQKGLRGRQHAGSRGDPESWEPLCPCPQSVLLWLEHASCADPGCACHPPSSKFGCKHAPFSGQPKT